MKTKIEIAPKYSFLREVILSLPENFSNHGRIVCSEKNVIRSVVWEGILVEIKQFKYNTLVDRYWFATFGKSKAQLGYENSDRLLNLGINTPERIAYITSYKYGMLYEDFYVYLSIDYKSLDELIKLPLSSSLNALKTFARFSFNLHSLGIFPKDYTANNIAYTLRSNEYNFVLIDNDRISFSKFFAKKGVRNLQRLYLPADRFSIIISEYALKARIDGLKTLGLVLFIKRCRALISLRKIYYAN